MSLDLEFHKRRLAQERALADQGGPSAAIHRQLADCYQAKIDDAGWTLGRAIARSQVPE